MRLLSRIILPIAMIISLFSGAVALPEIASALDATPISRIDLAAVPPLPADLPEPGYQFAQGGALDLAGLMRAWSDGKNDAEPWSNISSTWVAGYTQVLVLLTDRADASSDPIASLTTWVLEFDRRKDARSALADLLAIGGYSPAEVRDGVTTVHARNGAFGAIASDRFVIVNVYARVAIAGPHQNTVDWVDPALADLTHATEARLGLAIDAVENREPAPGTANLLVTGPDAPWSLPWIYYPATEHYRVRSGVVLPYGGELAAQADEALPRGAVDVFVSRQQFGSDGYDHMIDVTLAVFETDSDAEEFAAHPIAIEFPPGFAFDVRYHSPEDEAGTAGERVQRATVDTDVLRASGWRSIRRVGVTVQVVQWLGSGTAMVGEDAFRSYSAEQSACLDAMPEPCAPKSQDDLQVAVNAENSESTLPTSEPSTGDGMAISSAQFGWQVIPPPADAWKVIDVQIIGSSEYYQLQSGRSLMTIETAVDQIGEPQRCVLDNMRLLQQVEEHSVIELGSDDPDERPAGLEPGHGWAIYTVEPLQEERADQEYTIRIDCYTLVEGLASLVVTHIAPRDLWSEERDKGERFRAEIQLPSSASGALIRSPFGDTTWRRIVRMDTDMFRCDTPSSLVA